MTHFTHIVYSPKALRDLPDWRWPGFINRGTYGYAIDAGKGFQDHMEVRFSDFNTTLVEGEAAALNLADQLAGAHPGQDVFVATITAVYSRKVEPVSKVVKISPKGVLPA